MKLFKWIPRMIPDRVRDKTILNHFIRWLSTFILIISTLIIIILTPFGSNVIVGLLSKTIPGKMSYTHFSGSLAGPFDFSNFAYQNNSLKITIKHLHADWSPLALLRKKLLIRQLSAQHIKIITPATKFSFANLLNITPKPLKLPWQLKVKQSDLTDIQWGHAPKDPLLKLKYLQAQGSLKTKNINFYLTSELLQPNAMNISLQLQGSMTDYKVHLKVHDHKKLWEVKGKGNAQSIQLATQPDKVLDGYLNGQIYLNWNQYWRWDLQLNTKNLNLQTIDKTWAHNITIDLSSQGSMQPKHEPIFSWKLIANTPHNTLATDGTHDQNWQINWQANINNSQEILSTLQGSLQTEGTLTGTFADPIPKIFTSGKLTLKDFRWQNYSTEQLDNSWQIDFKDKQDFQVQMNAKNSQLAGITFLHTNLSSTGSLTQHQINFVIENPDLQFKGVVNGDWEDAKNNENNKNSESILRSKNPANRWSGDITTLSLQGKTTGSWQLKQSAKLTITPNNIDIPNLCLKSNNNENLCFNFVKQKNSWQTNIQADQIVIPEYHVAIHQVKIAANTAQNNKIILNASGQSGGHPVSVQGNIDLTKSNRPIELNIHSDNAEILNTPDYAANASADMKITIIDHDVSIEGKALIPQASIHPIDFNGVVTMPDEDIVFVGVPKNAARNNDSPWKVHINLDVMLGDNIQIKALGLAGKLTGKVTILHDPDQETMGMGRIDIVDGTYKIFGRELTIANKSGIFFHNSPLQNPFLNIQAYTSILTSSKFGGQELEMDNVKVGVNVAGTASNPQLTFYSNAALSQTDILSYLVLGTRNERASPATAGLLLNALSSLRHGNPQKTASGITNQIRQGLGFSEFSLETETTNDAIGEPTKDQTTYVVVGKHLTPRLSVRYKVDPFTSNNILTLFYLLSKHIRLETDRSVLGTGGDIFYIIDSKSNPSPTHSTLPKPIEAAP